MAPGLGQAHHFPLRSPVHHDWLFRKGAVASAFSIGTEPASAGQGALLERKPSRSASTGAAGVVILASHVVIRVACSLSGAGSPGVEVTMV